MLGIELTGAIDAAGLVGVVLAQALVLYVGYGGLQRVVGPKLLAMIESGA
jgi:hypothetical protein